MSFTSDTILVALELSNSLWLVDTRMAAARSSQMHRVSAGDTVTLLRLLDGLLANGREQGVPTRIENRISALLVTQGIRSRPSLRSWERDLALLETGD